MRWALLLSAMLACGGGDEAGVSFSGNVQPILTVQCLGGGCHDAPFPAENLDLRPGAAYDQLVGVMAKQCESTLVVAGDPDASYLVNKLVGVDQCDGLRMPNQAGLQPDDFQTILDWIDAGAPDN